MRKYAVKKSVTGLEIKKCRKRLGVSQEEFAELANVSINVKASIGIAFFPEHGDDSNKIVAAADEAMYFVKKNGKANYHIYQPEDSQIEDLQHTL